MSKKRDLLYISLFFILAFALWIWLTWVPGTDSVQLYPDKQGEYQLSEYDFENTVYVVGENWDSWPEELYLPEELEHAKNPMKQAEIQDVDYVTYRLSFVLPEEGKNSYGIMFAAPAYAMRVYVNGEEAGSVGVPGESREETVAQEVSSAYYFSAQDGRVEIVLHISNFVHNVGAGAPILTIGTAENIAQFYTLSKVRSGLIFGFLLCAGLYHLSIFLLNRRQVATLLYSLSCLLQAFVSVNFILILFPKTNWQIAVRLEYIFFILAVSFLVLLINRLFPAALHRWISRGYLALCYIYIFFILVTDTRIFTWFLPLFQIVCTAMAIYAVVCLVIQLVQKQTIKNILAFGGIVIVTAFSVNEILIRNGIYLFGNMPGQSLGVVEGMVFFGFFYAMLLSIEQAEVNNQLLEAKQAVAAAKLRYEELLLKQGYSPQEKMADFELTNRETEVALLLLDGKSREEITQLLHISIGTVNYHCNNIYRKAGVKSVTELIALMIPNSKK